MTVSELIRELKESPGSMKIRLEINETSARGTYHDELIEAKEINNTRVHKKYILLSSNNRESIWITS